MRAEHCDTIAAIATPPGKGGVGVIRISGSLSLSIAEKITGRILKPRIAAFSDFKNNKGELVDQGLGLFFKGPRSFTGEDTVELQGHGGPFVMNLLLQTVLECGARLARPGEFSQRAFLNGKMDLTQAEAVIDLINASSKQAAQSALRSLQGEFSKQINVFLEKLTRLRIIVEASIDFPEEEIDFISENAVISDITELLQQLKAIEKASRQGVLLQEGMQVVITGSPNAGKSSLLNALTGRDSAIVTDTEGTTRDVLREYIQIDGLPFYILDTAGIRETQDNIEQEGVLRAKQAVEKADVILLIQDIVNSNHEFTPPFKKPTILIKNKIDLTTEKPRIDKTDHAVIIYLSVKTGEGLDLLKEYLKSLLVFEEGSGVLSVHERHLQALSQCCAAIQKGLDTRDIELLAEELSRGHYFLSEITGVVTADDLLGKIFSSFCIGK